MEKVSDMFSNKEAQFVEIENDMESIMVNQLKVMLMQIDALHDIYKNSETLHNSDECVYHEMTKSDSSRRKNLEDERKNDSEKTEYKIVTSLNASIPLTSEQKNIWFRSQMGQANSCEFNSAAVMRLEGELNIESLKISVKKIIHRHEILRTVISSDGELQIILPEIDIDIPLIDFSKIENSRRSKLIKEWYIEDSNKAFQLEKGPLFRLQILKTEELSYNLVMVFHHIVADTWSMGVFLKELEIIYKNLIGSMDIKLPDPVQFKDYINWLNKKAADQKLKEAEEFWRNTFGDIEIPVTDLPQDNKRVPSAIHNGRRTTMILNEEFTKTLKKFSIKQGTSVFTTLLSAFFVFIKNLNQQEEIVVGVPYAGQLDMGVRNLMGMCDNIFPLFKKVKEDKTYEEFIQEVKTLTLGIDNYKSFPLSLMENLKTPEISIVFNMDFAAPKGKFADLTFEFLPYPISFVMYDVFLNAVEIDGEIHLYLDYNSDLYEEITVEHWLLYYRNILEQAFENSHVPLNQVSLVREVALYNKYRELNIMKNYMKREGYNILLQKLGLHYEDNLYLIILDSSKRPLPELVPGNLHIVTIHGEYEPNDFWKRVCEGSIQLIETGEYARLLPSGEIEFLGSLNRNIRLNGYRINLDDVENTLYKLLGGQKGLVHVLKDPYNKEQDCITAYVDLGNASSKIRKLRSELKKSLPEYMIPKYFVQMDVQKVLNCSIEYKSLPLPDKSNLIGFETKQPENPTQEIILGIWKDILSTDFIGIDEDFFEYGGQSLKAAQMIYRIHKELDVKVPLREIFANSTVRALSEYIARAGKSIFYSIDKIDRRNFYEVSSVQKRLYVLHQVENNGTPYNMAGGFIIEGTIDKERLLCVFRNMVLRHEAFRTYFEQVDHDAVQCILEYVDFDMYYEEINENDINDRTLKFVKPFDLKKAPLLRVALFKIRGEKEKYLLFMDMHHIISDGLSMIVFMKDFIDLYQGRDLPLLRIQYKDFACWQNSIIKSETFKAQEEYWINKFSRGIPILNLPTDFERPSIQCFDGDHVKFYLEEELTLKVIDIAVRTGTTLFMVLISSYHLLLARYSRQEAIIIGTPVSGRPHADLQDVIGMFVNTLPLLNHMSFDSTFEDFLQSVKENYLEAFENQDYPLEELIQKLDIKRDISRNPLFDAVFALQEEYEDFCMGESRWIPYEFQNQTSKFDISLEGVRSSSNIGLCFEYSTGIFRRETIERFSKDYVKILETITNDVGIRVGDIELLEKYSKLERVLENEIELDF